MDIEQLIRINNKRELIDGSELNPNLLAFTRDPQNTRLDIIRTNIYNPLTIVDEKYETEENRLLRFIQRNDDFKNSLRNNAFNANSDFETDAMRYTSLGTSFNGRLYNTIAESEKGARNFQTITSDGMKNVISSNRMSEMFKNDQITPQSQLANEVARNIVVQLQQYKGISPMGQLLKT